MALLWGDVGGEVGGEKQGMYTSPRGHSVHDASAGGIVPRGIIGIPSAFQHNFYSSTLLEGSVFNRHTHPPRPPTTTHPPPPPPPRVLYGGRRGGLARPLFHAHTPPPRVLYGGRRGGWRDNFFMRTPPHHGSSMGVGGGAGDNHHGSCMGVGGGAGETTFSQR